MSTDSIKLNKAFQIWIVAFVLTILIGIGIAGLLLNIQTRKEEARQYPLMLQKVDDDNVQPGKWGVNFPAEYDGYLQMQESNYVTPYGGSLPYSKLIRYPQLTRLWAGYPFSMDFNEERSHYYSQVDQMETKRNDKGWLNAHGFPKFSGQPGACMNCHSGWAPKLIRELGWESFNKTPYVELSAKLIKEYGSDIHGGKLGGTCADCHSPKDMSLRVTRPAYIKAMVKRGYKEDPEHGIEGTNQEMRSHVCQQCHVEYYFRKENSELTFPWSKWPKDEPLRIEMIEDYYNEARSAESPFKADWIHKDSGALMLKIQHPETELYSSGIHARSGVACADCHMPYLRQGAVKVSMHKISSPFQNINGSCQICHNVPEEQIKARISFIQDTTAAALRQSEGAILGLIDDIKASTEKLLQIASVQTLSSQEEKDAKLESILGPAREYHRRASMRWDFIASENSTGFHSPQESIRVLQQASDMARRGQLELQNAMAKEGLSVPATSAAGIIPPKPTPIPHEAGSLVGSNPAEELLRHDVDIINKLVR